MAMLIIVIVGGVLFPLALQAGLHLVGRVAFTRGDYLPVLVGALTWPMLAISSLRPKSLSNLVVEEMIVQGALLLLVVVMAVARRRGRQWHPVLPAVIILAVPIVVYALVPPLAE